MSFKDAIKIAEDLIRQSERNMVGAGSVTITRSLLKRLVEAATIKNPKPSYPEHYVKRLQTEIKSKDTRIRLLEEQLKARGPRHEERRA